jgi:TPR repeat protein
LKLASDQGFAAAHVNSGLYLQNGKGVSVDDAEAANYFKLAVDQGFANAQFHSGCFLCNSNSMDIARAVNHVKLAADQHHPEVQTLFATLLRGRNGVSQDLPRGSPRYCRSQVSLCNLTLDS